ncbi:MAG: ferredoxin [Lachnospiraceae bacterium]|nr:ferredoxin [Lachnospiraceae bacterium]
MKAYVDPDVCIGCGMCAGMVDEVFRMNDEGKAEAYQEAAAEKKDAVQEAIDSCPVSAIGWEK